GVGVGVCGLGGRGKFMELGVETEVRRGGASGAKEDASLVREERGGGFMSKLADFELDLETQQRPTDEQEQESYEMLNRLCDETIAKAPEMAEEDVRAKKEALRQRISAEVREELLAELNPEGNGKPRSP